MGADKQAEAYLAPQTGGDHQGGVRILLQEPD